MTREEQEIQAYTKFSHSNQQAEIIADAKLEYASYTESRLDYSRGRSNNYCVYCQEMDKASKLEGPCSSVPRPEDIPNWERGY